MLRCAPTQCAGGLNLYTHVHVHEQAKFGHVYCDSGEIGLGIYESGEIFGRTDGGDEAAKFWGPLKSQLPNYQLGCAVHDFIDISK